MSDSNTSKYNGEPITFTDFQKALEAIRDFDISRTTKEQLRIEATLKYLQDKQKDLGKPIPLELLAITYSGQSVGSVFLEKYKEWII